MGTIRGVPKAAEAHGKETLVFSKGVKTTFPQGAEGLGIPEGPKSSRFAKWAEVPAFIMGKRNRHGHKEGSQGVRKGEKAPMLPKGRRLWPGQRCRAVEHLAVTKGRKPQLSQWGGRLGIPKRSKHW